MRPGRHLFATCLPGRDNGRPLYFIHKCIVQRRDEDPPIKVKEIRFLKSVRVFEKHNSVFKDWLPDTAKQLTDSIEHDVLLWKCSRFIKVDKELEAACQVAHDHAEILKTLFTQVSARGNNYPYVGW
jgi:hypothetical protein